MRVLREFGKSGLMGQLSMKQKKRAVVNRKLCVACGSCQKVCPMEAILVYKGLYAKTDEARCIGCGRCVKECPASVITLEARHEN